MIVRKFADLSTAGLEEKHNNNNQEIFEKITNFVKHNNLSPEDFFIAGSSCCSYMNYLILDRVRDIDVFLTKDIQVEKTEGIDIISNQVIQNYVPELVEKDGFYFLTPWHVTAKCAVKALLRRKKQSVIYFRFLLDYMNMTIEEFQERFEQEVEQHVFPYSDKDALEIVKNNMHLLQNWGKPFTVLPDFLSAIPVSLEENTTQKIVYSGQIPE